MTKVCLVLGAICVVIGVAISVLTIQNPPRGHNAGFYLIFLAVAGLIALIGFGFLGLAVYLESRTLKKQRHG